MKKYLSFFRIRFLNSLQYRAAAYAGMATQFFWGGMLVLMYRAFYRADAAAFPMAFQQTASYVWLQQAFLWLFMTWGYDNEIFAQITQGTIAYELARPVPVYSMWFLKQAANRSAGAFLRCIPVLTVSFLLPKPYGLMLPDSIQTLLLFLMTLVLGFFTMLAFQMLAYILVFYTMSPSGVRMVMATAGEFLSGGLIPIPFMPQKMQDILTLTPFAAMQNLPLRVYIGDIAGGELANAVILQLFWLAAVLFVGNLWIRRALRRVVVQGG